jgi:PAS domain S-box-containing protein
MFPFSKKVKNKLFTETPVKKNGEVTESSFDEIEEKPQEAKNTIKTAFNIASDLKDEEEKLAEEKVKAESLINDLSKFKLALDNASDLVIITDPYGIVVYGNQAIEKMTGYKVEEALGKKAGALWSESMPDEYYKNLWHTIEDLKRPFIGEIQNRRKNGEQYTASISAFPVLNKEGNIIFYVSIERDITKEKEIDKAKSEFISLASHQMRTPLTAINWYTEMLLDGDAGQLNEKQTEYFKEVYAAGQRMNEIIKSFLHILRLETGTMVANPVSVDLSALTKSTIEESRLDIEKKHIRIAEHSGEPVPSVRVDAELTHVILQNIVSNAVKYSTEGGEIEISLESVKQGEAVGGKTAPENSVVVSVHDSGIGISETDQEKIFSKFFRADNAKRQDPNGNGIGLYMAKFMADMIGGDIWFESAEGKGTTFHLLLSVEGKKLT